jgi:hypothetical protein
VNLCPTCGRKMPKRDTGALLLPKPVKRKGRGAWDRSEALKAKRGYTNPSSFVRVDGTEVLKGIDWTNRKAELRERSGGRCEYMIPDFAPEEGFLDQRCFKSATITAHVEPRHPRRNDEMKNLKHYCFEHDKLTEKQGWRRTRFGESGGLSR